MIAKETSDLKRIVLDLVGHIINQTAALNHKFVKDNDFQSMISSNTKELNSFAVYHGIQIDELFTKIENS